MKISVEMLRKAVEEEDDFGHEMRVRRVLLSVPRAKVEHGWSYTDPVEGKPRQFDLRFEYITKEAGSRRLLMAVECKNLSADAPLIVSGTNRTNDEAFHCYMGSFSESKTSAGIPQPPSVFWISEHNQAYQIRSFVGKSLLRLKPDGGEKALVRASGPDEIYRGWSQALASANELCERAKEPYMRGHLRTFSLILPIVVVPDNTLWEMHYDLNGVPADGPVPVDEAQYFINYKVEVRLGQMRKASISLSHIHFFTLKGLQLFLTSMTQTDRRWEEWIPPSYSKEVQLE